ncbi:3-oxoacyl-[acyl-carrier-protein] synthase 3 [Formosimonas limnophila]|uniref:Beta-ketoacyl-[acyl-carrier-protein] synthase III n=1 Tax=Formosimonas limnophila TaxID=1384487 RepID=A0A8J3G0R0_9BURK|nr:beta-ketoacyl-ACP synthase III [Formosimonas limnophila]GHA74343.1 3-oxoacyl-[acyl-carrier-protein] synthase 3 [Formosimonas limnophila]
MTQRYSKIIGTGRFLPNSPVSNDELAARLAKSNIETSDAWIRERTGIAQRYIANSDQTTSELGAHAARAALEMAGVEATEIDLIIVATSTPDMTFPSTACLLQAKIGATGCAAFDVQAVCSGFVYALATADALIKAGQARTALVVGAEVFSRLLDWTDRTTCVLFGDGAGAVVLQASDEPGILANRLHARGDLSNILCATGTVSHGVVQGHPFLYMDGQAVFKQAVTVLGEVANEVLDGAHMTADQIDWLIPHQANIRILQATAKRLGVSMDKVITTVDLHGNTSAASVPMALDVAVRDGRIQKGHHVLMQGVGGGFTWGANLFKF